MHQEQTDWTEIIRPSRSLLDLRLREVWHYRDLLAMFVKRDFAATYKQTLLGPLWFVIQPILTTIIFTVVFASIAKIPTGGQPPMVFYLAGITIWNFFVDTFTKTANVFTANANLFGKVYFPRLVMPLAVTAGGTIRFGVQLVLFLIIWLYYFVSTDSIHPHWGLIFGLVPILVLLMAGFALSAGIIFSSLTTKYRDLAMLINFGVQLFMYATPVIYSMEMLDPKYLRILQLNPLSGIVETFRYAFLGSGTYSPSLLIYSVSFLAVLFIMGILVFNKVERSFMDTV